MRPRTTSQRKAIRQVFLQSDRPLSTEEVFVAARVHHPGLGIATVYRTVRMLLDQGWLTAVRLPGVPPRYELAGRPHHHHFYCTRCNRAFEVPGNVQLLDSLVPRGFVLDRHDLVMYGACAECAGGAGKPLTGSSPTSPAD